MSQSEGYLLGLNQLSLQKVHLFSWKFYLKSFQLLVFLIPSFSFAIFLSAIIFSHSLAFIPRFLSWFNFPKIFCWYLQLFILLDFYRSSLSSLLFAILNERFTYILFQVLLQYLFDPLFQVLSNKYFQWKESIIFTSQLQQFILWFLTASQKVLEYFLPKSAQKFLQQFISFHIIFLRYYSFALIKNLHCFKF